VVQWVEVTERVLIWNRREGVGTIIQPYDSDFPRVEEPRIRTEGV